MAILSLQGKHLLLQKNNLGYELSLVGSNIVYS